MDLSLSGSSPLPIYRQLFDQLCGQILDGRLKSGDALPPIRTVAKELSISVIPVKRAWEELEAAGFIESFFTRHTEWPELLRLSIILCSLTFVIYYYIVLPKKRNHESRKTID